MGNRRVLLIFIATLVTASLAGIISRDSDNSSSEESKDTEEFMSEVRSACLLKTGSNETFEKMATQFTLVPICVASTLDVDSFSSDMDNLTKHNRVEFFDKYCPQFHDSLSCLTPITTEFRKCLDDDELEFIDIAINLIPEAVNMMCKDHGQIFYMDDINFDECLSNFFTYAEKCLDKISNTTEAMDLSNYGAKQCAEVEQVRECLQTKLDGCKAPRLIDLFDIFYRPVVKASPCKNFITLDEVAAVESNTI